MSSYKGKVAIVTGSTDGIGLAIARKMGLSGAAVVVSSRKQNNVDRAVKELQKEGINVIGVVCNVSNPEQRDRLISATLAKYGKIDILVSNAGINPAFGSLLDVTESVWDKLFSTNVKAGFLLAKAVVPHMEKNGSGAILFVSSISAYTLAAGIAAYGVTKTALLGLTRALADELAPKKIRVNCLAPGIIKTEMSRALWDGGKEGLDSLIAEAQIPMGRMGTSEECAEAAAFLCSDGASYVTGETMVVAGGARARL